MSRRTRGITRREFGRRAALAAASAALPTTLLASVTPAATPAEQATPQRPQPSAESQAEVDTKYQAVLRKYGARLSNEQKADVKRLLGVLQKNLENLRAFPLENWDEPAAALRLVPESPARTRRKRAR